MEFNFQFDEKVEVWTRTRFTVKAQTKEEAEQIALNVKENLENYVESDDTVECSYTEILYETMVELKKGTYKELLTDDGKVIWEAKAE